MVVGQMLQWEKTNFTNACTGAVGKVSPMSHVQCTAPQADHSWGSIIARRSPSMRTSKLKGQVHWPE